jgi:uncharacterized protein (DUF1330 family)
MADDATRYVLVYGAQVEDEAMYRRYREGMIPILQQHGGAFIYDFAVSRVLISETEQPINRVFAIRFARRAGADALFADPSYLAVRAAWFEPSVAAVTQIGTFEQPRPGGRPAT